MQKSCDLSSKKGDLGVQLGRQKFYRQTTCGSTDRTTSSFFQAIDYNKQSAPISEAIDYYAVGAWLHRPGNAGLSKVRL